MGKLLHPNQGWYLALLLQTALSEVGRAHAGQPTSQPEGLKSSAGLPPREDPGFLMESKPSVEELRSLLHIYTRLNKPRMVEMVAVRILSRDPREKETLRLLARFYLERADARRALKFARALVAFHPGDADGQFLLAAAYKLDGQPRQASEILENLKAVEFGTKPFPYQLELATDVLESGGWPHAVSLLQEALEDPSLALAKRAEARATLDRLYRDHLPQLALTEVSTFFHSGLILRSLVEWSQPLAAHYRLNLAFARDDLELNEAPLLRGGWKHRYDGVAAIDADYPHWKTRLAGGFGDQGALYGATVTRKLGQNDTLGLGLFRNQRATDSLLLEMLAGREDDVFLSWHTQLPLGVAANLGARGRRVIIHDETLGYAYTIDLNLERVLFRKAPQLRLGYRGLITDFQQSSQNPRLVDGVVAAGVSDPDRLAVLHNLVEPINLHGMYLLWQDTLNASWGWHALAGSDYSFTRSTLGYTLEGGVSYLLNKSSELRVAAGYSTSASTSQQDSERVELSVALRMHF